MEDPHSHTGLPTEARTPRAQGRAPALKTTAEAAGDWAKLPMPVSTVHAVLTRYRQNKLHDMDKRTGRSFAATNTTHSGRFPCALKKLGTSLLVAVSATLAASRETTVQRPRKAKKQLAQ